MNPSETFANASSRVLVWKQDIPLSDFIERTVRLSSLWEVTRGSYDFASHPYLREIADAINDPDVQRITVLKSTRVGGTLLFIAAALALSELDPSPCMFVSPDETSGIELRDRLYDTAAESPLYAARIPPQKNWNARAIDLQTMKIYLAWAGSKQRLRGRTVQRLFRSEIDVYPQFTGGREDVFVASEQRIKRSFYSLIYDESSPVGETSRIQRFHDQGDQRRWQCPCPHCGLFQEFRFFPHRSGEHAGRGGFGGLHDDHGNLLSDEQVLDSAHYICLNGCRLENLHKNPMMRAGIWVPRGCTVDGGKLTGTSLRSGRHRSYHLWTISIPTRSIGQIAESYVRAHHQNLLSSWIENELGVARRGGRRIPTWDIVGKRFAGLYERSEVPAESYFLTAGVDVQLHGVYWSIWAWGDGAAGYLIDWGYQRRYDRDDEESEDLTIDSIASDLVSLDQTILNRRLRLPEGQKNPLGNSVFRVGLAAIDANYRKNAVMRFLYHRHDLRLRAVRGDHHKQARSAKDRFSKSTIDRTRTGEKLSQQRELWNINSSHYKQDLFDRMQLKAPDVNSPPPLLQFPLRMTIMGQDFLRSFCNDRPVEEKGKLVWEMPEPSIGRDYFHASVYAAAAADMLLTEAGLNWDARHWKAATQASSQPPQIGAVRDDQI